MAFYRCGTSGGTLSETTLWTNPDPSATFPAQDVTLSQSIANFEYIAFTYARNRSNLSDVYRVMYPMTEIQKWAASTSTSDKPFGIIATRSGTSPYKRTIYRVSDMTLNFKASLALAGETPNNSTLIPLAIIGMK